MSDLLLLALTEAQGKTLTIIAIIVVALVLGVIVISSDSNWFDS